MTVVSIINGGEMIRWRIIENAETKGGMLCSWKIFASNTGSQVFDREALTAFDQSYSVSFMRTDYLYAVCADFSAQ